jgi:hypothetical protein
MKKAIKPFLFEEVDSKTISKMKKTMNDFFKKKFAKTKYKLSFDRYKTGSNIISGTILIQPPLDPNEIKVRL